MTSVALGAGAFILSGGNPMAARLGFMAGLVVDQAYDPFGINKRPDVYGPRLNSFRFQGTDEGAAVSRIYGRNVRCSGQIIYLSPPIEEQNSTSQNGKGGRGGELIEWVYKAHVAVAICKNPISKVKKIIANGKVIYSEDPDLVVTASDQISGTALSSTYWQGGLSPGYKHNYDLRLDSPSGGPDLSGARVGLSVTMSGVGATNVGSWQCVDSGTNVDGSTYLTVRRREIDGYSAFSSFAASPVTLVTLHQVQQQWSTKVMGAAPKFYLGSDTQSADPLLQSLLGSVPAYRGYSYVVLNSLVLTDSVNVLPQFSFVVEQDPNCIVGDAIAGECYQTGLDPSQIDVSACTDPLETYEVRGVQTARGAIQPLMLAYELISYEDDGQLVFIKRRDAEDLTIDSALLAAHAEGSDAPRDVAVEDADDTLLASQVDITFLDPDRDYQPGHRRAVRRTATRHVPREINLPLALAGDDAEALATRMLWLERANAHRVLVDLPPSLIPTVREGLRLNFTAHDRDWSVLALLVDRGDDGMLHVEGVEEQARLFPAGGPSFAAILSASELGSGTQHRGLTAQPIDWHILDCAALTDEHLFTPGLYVACALTSVNESFTGAVLYESVDDGSTWTVALRIREAAVMGSSLDALASGTAGALDATNTVDVVLTNGELESVSSTACQNGRNRAMLGGEIIGFETATLIDTNTYRLSNIWRGLRDTGAEMATHDVGDRFVLLTGPGIYFQRLSLSSIGMSRLYKLVTIGGNIDEFASQEHSPTGANTRPFAPTALAGTRDGSNNLTISWTRTTRAIEQIGGSTGQPLVDPEEGYEVDILDAFGGVLRTISTPVPRCRYSALQQTADGFTPGDPVDVAVYQLGDVVGRGNAATGTV